MENRKSLVAMAKRNSAYLVPMNIIDPRASWTGQPGQPGQPPDPSYQSSNIRRIEEDELSLTRAETHDTLKDNLKVEEKEEDIVLGSTEIFDKDGNIRLVPTPTPDPKDPLNLSEWRKWAAVASMCFFGSISLAAEIAVAGLTPVFLLEYSGVDPASTLKNADLKGNPDPLAVIPPGVQPVSLTQVSLLATIPLLSNGFATYLLVPLSTAIGRRPVLILTSTLSWASGFWAGASTSLTSHIAARVFHGLGSGAVEALLPLIVQDIMFIHQRNKAVAAIIAAQVSDTRFPESSLSGRLLTNAGTNDHHLRNSGSLDLCQLHLALGVLHHICHWHLCLVLLDRFRARVQEAAVQGRARWVTHSISHRRRQHVDTLLQLVSSSGLSSPARTGRGWTTSPMVAVQNGMILASSSMGTSGKRGPARSSPQPRLRSSRP